MPHHSPLISTIVIALALAWMLGALALGFAFRRSSAISWLAY
jgi:predicted Kef-type K+ transport protein